MKKYTSILFKELLEKSNLSHRQFAQLNGLDRPQVSRYLRGEVSISFNRAMQLAQKYQIDLNGMLNAKNVSDDKS